MPTRPATLLPAAPALALAALAAGAGAQPAPLVETVDVELVLVDVLVTDRRGRPVLDLRREDFTLFDDGELVEISQFSPPTATSARTSEGAPEARPRRESAAPGREDRFVVFLDELHLGPGSRRRVLIQLAETLGRVPPKAELLLATFDGAVRVEVPFTRQHRRVIRAVEEKIRTPPPRLVEGMAEERMLALMPFILQTSLENLRFVPLDQRVELACSNDLASMARQSSEQIRSRVEAAAGALNGFVDSLGGFDGRKVLLHVSDGIPLIAGQVGWEYAIELCDGSLAAQGAVKDSVPELEVLPPARMFPSAARLDMMSYSTQSLWDGVTAAANANRVTFYTLQASGLTTLRAASVEGARTSMTTDTADRMNQQDVLFAMADETGGRATLNTNDFREVVERMVDDSSLLYELAFVPRPDATGRPHRLDVEVARDGIEVRHRKSYRLRSPDALAGDRLLTALLHGRTQNPHAARLIATPSGKRVRKRAEVVITLLIPFEELTLLPGEKGLHGQVSVLLAARDEAGNRTGVGEKSLVLEVDPADVGEQFEYQVSMELPVGSTYQIAAAVRDLVGGESSYLTAALPSPLE
ncbi:MAG: VWA domain-containing protein [Thermoanaerobaculia bacterium]|nr:VWA domain-containing protein [Thermoanaerobaculia bacterium]